MERTRALEKVAKLHTLFHDKGAAVGEKEAAKRQALKLCAIHTISRAEIRAARGLPPLKKSQGSQSKSEYTYNNKSSWDQEQFDAEQRYKYMREQEFINEQRYKRQQRAREERERRARAERYRREVEIEMERIHLELERMERMAAIRRQNAIGEAVLSCVVTASLLALFVAILL